MSCHRKTSTKQQRPGPAPDSGELHDGQGRVPGVPALSTKRAPFGELLLVQQHTLVLTERHRVALEGAQALLGRKSEVMD